MDFTAITTLLGGIGLFLLGMSLMTESLTVLGGGALRRLVARVTRNRYYGLLTGAAVTATLQSSSATTLVTVGFVSAGLLSFTDSLGVIFGANLGTTSTAWIVSLIGLKVRVSVVALPLVGVGAMVRLVTRGRRSRLGLALAGFGLIFVGIDVMQEGMSGVNLDLSSFAGGSGPLSTLLLVGIGLLMTVVMQSSSAAVATTLVVLDAGSISLTQAAALVIGQNVGTTVTAIMGSLGGNVAARRAAVAHTMFNVFTGVIAIALLAPFVTLVERLGARLADGSSQTAIALFHSAFNVLGVAVFVPLAPRFAKLVKRLVPERGDPAVQRLSKAALQIPAVALEAARRSAAEVTLNAMRLAAACLRAAASRTEAANGWQRARELLADPRAILDGADEASRRLATEMNQAGAAAEAITVYLGRIRTASQPASVRDEHVELLHAMDHVQRLSAIIARDDEVETVSQFDDLRRFAAQVAGDLEGLCERASSDPLGSSAETADALKQIRDRATERRKAIRAVVLARMADADLDLETAERRLGGARWIAKIPKHARRALLHVAWTSGAPAVGDMDPDPDEE